MKPAALNHEVDALHALFQRGPSAVLTGAGISTDSGIPDYRGPETRRRARNPLQYRELVRSAAARQRYWARSMLGWTRFASATPNPGHQVLTQLERHGQLRGVITQNVDSLHQAAGSQHVIELHGALRTTRCSACGVTLERHALQQALRERNPSFEQRAAEQAPDGDADIDDAWIADFKVVDCSACGGALRPDVVFFGENVPGERVGQALALVESAGALLVVGSSLAVYSGLRFVHHAHKRGIPVAILCLGPTRGDPYASLRIDAGASATLLALAERMGVA